MSICVLAGDIGGTKTNLAIYALAEHGKLAPVREASFPSREYQRFDDVVAAFLPGAHERIAAAAFGIAGPVLGGVVQVTNLPWRIESAALGHAMGCPSVRLMNDLEATAFGALSVGADQLVTLNTGQPRLGNRAVIAAGTGLGEALLFWDGKRYHASATEGGHVDFGARDERERELLRFLSRQYGRVSWERVLSGPGLHNIFRFLDEEVGRSVPPAVRERMAREDPSAVIGELGVSGGCPVCVEAVELFVSLYGSQAGNFALTAMAVGGVYVGGGIAPKLLPKLQDGRFKASFVAKDPHRAWLEQVPVHVLLDPKTSLLGAAYAAAELV
ncbi:MAG: glucokinase [Candidatus Binatia bacterium]